jgi:hypothetical protein
MELIMGLSLSLILLGALGVFLSYLNLGPLSQQIWQGFALIGISKDYIRFSTFILFGLGIALFLIGYAIDNLKRSKASRASKEN